MRYLISDPHFGHANIIKYCNRPYKDVHHMNSMLTQNWNSVVTIDDTVICLGDFGFGNVSKYLERLNGHKILVLGNHDKESQCRGHFEEIHTRLEIEINGQKVLLSHYPYKDSVGDFDHKFLDRMPERNGDQWLFHGHVHNSKPMLGKRMLNMSVEWHNYTPVSETRIIEIMNENQ